MISHLTQSNNSELQAVALDVQLMYEDVDDYDDEDIKSLSVHKSMNRNKLKEPIE